MTRRKVQGQSHGELVWDPSADVDIEQIALNAVRWRDKRGDQYPASGSEAMAQGDRRWLLGYIDRRAAAAASRHNAAACPECGPIVRAYFARLAALDNEAKR